MAKTSVIPKSKAKTAFGLLSEVRKLIIDEPKRYDQTAWLYRDGDPQLVEVPSLGYPKCGTVACVAGWVATLASPSRFDYVNAAAIACDVLGLNENQEDELFNGGAVRGARQTPTHAKSGAKHIAKFQKKYRAQLLAKKV